MKFNYIQGLISPNYAFSSPRERIKFFGSGRIEIKNTLVSMIKSRRMTPSLASVQHFPALSATNPSAVGGSDLLILRIMKLMLNLPVLDVSRTKADFGQKIKKVKNQCLK